MEKQRISDTNSLQEHEEMVNNQAESDPTSSTEFKSKIVHVEYIRNYNIIEINTDTTN